MVKIYTTQTCPYCVMAKDYFKSKGVQYEEVDVSASETAREELIKKSHQMGVPVIDANGAIIVGFNRTEIDKALGL
ncbi:MAG: Glutaredoxin-like protein, YruB-family [Candidatus Wolfebacteria bacterium GW2011_GWA2_42_10]|uniref:Glutaredoxin-like protein, YruB-family n=2 Tax=Candidatus Wolfeibacteriota TaxID=1752735 RepID=A0A0G0XLX8_9BACT|nr:MAG: Glutaredoxin-like protein, YruB-family [Candidatus Wolfebacteria bacterium GW2011_GWB1_41_12]KKS25477.1 MAG: Glutaredoxin-like protein, YruB-family [Candidatus Wolfebacteria bacterium GW2011_GWA2_42_10]KKT56654.1 MAG: Glutaredoxin-like protein, YruB-family [Candidatus Wolfebacteria bacterium GW2011_GWA1_44_24]